MTLWLVHHIGCDNKFKTFMNAFTIVYASTLKIIYCKVIAICHPEHKRMVCLNFNVSPSIIILLANTVFIKVFNFQGHNLLSTNAFSHSCFTFFNFLSIWLFYMYTTLGNLHTNMFQTCNHLFIICNVLIGEIKVD